MSPEEVGATVVGSSEADAREAIVAAGCVMRVATRDGVSHPLTMDFRSNRINVAVDDGVVTAASVG